MIVGMCCFSSIETGWGKQVNDRNLLNVISSWEFLGHAISRQGICTDTTKITTAVQNWKTHNLVLTENFAANTRPLYQLMKQRLWVLVECWVYTCFQQTEIITIVCTHTLSFSNFDKTLLFPRESQVNSIVSKLKP